jgi:arylsulfatase A-like enzyme
MSEPSQERHPNIIFMLPDQLRADFLGCYGASFAKTPRIDRLAELGTKYRDAVAPSPVCVPARAALLSGVNGLRSGVLDNGHWLRPDHDSAGPKGWPTLLREHGYHTAAIGKMHFYPWDAAEGFETRIIAEDKRHINIQDDYARHLARHGRRKYHGSELEGYYENKGAVLSNVTAEHQVDLWVAREARRYLNVLAEQRTRRPFAMMVGFPSPHCPYDPLPEYLDALGDAEMPKSIPRCEHTDAIVPRVVASNKRPWNGVDYSEFSEAQKQTVRRHYSALVSQVDDAVGTVLDTLSELGMDQDTVIIFASDHGDYLGDFGLMGKYFFHQPSVHVPVIVYDPRSAAHGTEQNEPVSLTDIYATILSLAGVEHCETPDSRVLGGELRPDRGILGMTNRGTMYRRGQWKLSRYETGELHLFDLHEDPRELQNYAHDPAYRDVMQSMMQEMFAESLRSLADGHADKAVPEAAFPGMPVFNRPGWQRPYPVPVSRRRAPETRTQES